MTCACPSCLAITGVRLRLSALLSDMATELTPDLGATEAHKAVLAAISLTIGDAILAWVEEDMRLDDVEKHAELLRVSLGGRGGETLQ